MVQIPLEIILQKKLNLDGKINKIMKYKYINFTLPVLGMLLAACSADDALEQTPAITTPVAQEKEVVFSANIESDIVTRTGYASGTQKTVWSLSDKIMIFNSTKSDSKIFTLFSGENTKEGTFKQDKTIEGNTVNLSLDNEDAVYAFYPSDKGTFSGTSVSASIPSAQDAKKATATPFETGYSYMLAQADANNNLAFKNVLSFIKITVTPSTNFPISKIKVVANTSNNSVNLAGSFKASISGGITSVSNIEKGSTFVEVNGTNMGGTYYLAVLPTANKVPLTLLIEDVEGNQAYQRVNSGFKIEPSQIYDFGSYDATGDNSDAIDISSKILSHVVDLGLPSGTLWAMNDLSNVAGDDNSTTGYYAWAETNSKALSLYDWNSTTVRKGLSSTTTANYKYGMGTTTDSDNYIRVYNTWLGITEGIQNGAAGMLKKYNSESAYKQNLFNWFGVGVQDNVVVLAAEDDVAYTHSSGVMSMPTKEQATELVDNTTGSAYTRTAKRDGYTSISVSFPATGFKRDGNSMFSNDNNKDGNPYKYSLDSNTGYYWTKTRAYASDGQGKVVVNGESKSPDFMANSLEITSGAAAVKRADRCEGRKVRPVVYNVNIAPAKTYETLKEDASKTQSNR